MHFPFLVAALLAGAFFALGAVTKAKVVVDPPKWAIFLAYFPSMLRIFFQPEDMRLLMAGMGFATVLASAYVLVSSQ